MLIFFVPFCEITSRSSSVLSENHSERWIIFSKAKMKIFFITFATLFTSYSAQALSCYSCPTGTTFNDCVTDHVTQKCSDDKKHCITIKTYVIKSSGEQVLYLEKDCGEAVACGQPDPGSLVCNMKNTSYTFKGHKMANCTARCCAADLCNNDDLPLLATSSRPSLSVIATVVPSSPQPGDAITTAKPTGCGTKSISLPMHMTVALAAVVLLALFNFELM